MLLERKVSVIIAILSIFLFLINSPAEAFQEDDDSQYEFVFSPSWFNFLGYNKVEGVFLGTTLKTTHTKFYKTSLITSLGYGLDSEEWRYNVSLEHFIDPFFFKKLSISVFDETSSINEEFISDFENTMAALMIKQDFRDYYRGRGIVAEYTHKIRENFRFELGLGFKQYYSLSTRADWSLLRKDRDFDFNPPITEGDEVLAVFGLKYDNRESAFIDANYWDLELKLEREFNDFDFTGFHMKLERIQLGPGSQTMVAGIRGAARSCGSNEQYLMDIGGIGTLRGYDHKEFTGNRILLFNFNYDFNGDILQKIPLQKIPLYSSLKSAFFIDSGLAWLSDEAKNGLYGGILPSGSRETGSRINDIRSNIGMSFFLFNGTFKINIAKRLDRSYDPWYFTFRMFQLF
ncbi:MAG: hypothetical protein GY863_13735 [bacterium]|nr:hypothetical protein [bacterium]